MITERLKQKNSNQTTELIVVFFISGIIAGIISLMVTAPFEPLLGESPFQNFNLLTITFCTLEELIKLIIIFFLLSSFGLNYQTKEKSLPIWGLLMGTGFGLFEVALSFLSGFKFSPGMILPILIHVTTSIFILSGVYNYINKKNFPKLIILFLLAITVHICYNALVLV